MTRAVEPGLAGPLAAGVDVGATGTSVVIIHRIGSPEREGVGER